MNKSFVFSLLSIISLLAGVSVNAAIVTYDFEADTVGQQPSGVTVTAGSFIVQNQAMPGNTLTGSSTGTTTIGVLLNNFASTTDYTVTWKESYDVASSEGRHGFTLRSQTADLSATPGIKHGYLFQVNHPGVGGANANTVKIYRISSVYTQLVSRSIVSTSTQWFKASVIGSNLELSQSTDGVNYFIVATTTNATYASGGVQYTAGYGAPIGRDYVDNIVQATTDMSGPVISSIASSTLHTTANITWATDEYANSQVEYGLTSAYTASTTLDARFMPTHSASLTGLVASTTYHYRIRGADVGGNIAYSADQTFTTMSPQANYIAVTSPVSYQVIQRGEDNLGHILISGTYTGFPAYIEASWNGREYVPIVENPTGGNFNGALYNLPPGQGTLSVRFSNDIATMATTSYVGIGDIFVIAGQSNASGRGTNNQSYTHASLKASLFANSDTWKNLTDPTDSVTGQIDSVSLDGAAAGSVWPLIATQYLADQNVPVAFIPTSKGGVSALQWQPDTSTSTLYGSMSRRIAAAGGKIKAVLFYQGEADASLATSPDTYLAQLNTIANAIYNDFGVKTVVGQIANAGYATSSIDTIRLAQIKSWDISPAILPGPAFVDVNLADEGGDNLHFKSNGDLQVFANRWWASLKKNFYGGVDGRGPRLVSSKWGATRSEILLTFTDESLPLLPASTTSGFSVSDSLGIKAIAFSVRTLDNQVKLTLASDAVGETSVSFASGKSAIGNTILTDSSSLQLPAEVFINIPVTDEMAPQAQISHMSAGSSGGGLFGFPISNTETKTTQLLATYAFTKSLSTGMRNGDVSNLQKYLNSKGFTVSAVGPGSVGNETSFFGAATRSALARFQKANKISPAVGFFGPMTRAFVANMK